jgi:hypothetical protein
MIVSKFFNIFLLIIFLVIENSPMWYIYAYNAAKKFFAGFIEEDNNGEECCHVKKCPKPKKKCLCKCKIIDLNSCENPHTCPKCKINNCKPECNPFCPPSGCSKKGKVIPWIINDPNIIVNNATATQTDDIVFLQFDILINNMFNGFAIQLPVPSVQNTSDIVMLDYQNTDPLEFWYGLANVVGSQLIFNHIPMSLPTNNTPCQSPNNYRVRGQLFYKRYCGNNNNN